MLERQRLAWVSRWDLAITSDAIAYWTMFSVFAPHDDEDYLLQTLRDLVRGGDLYDEVYSQYEPLLMTKINIRVFACLGIGLAMALTSSGRTIRGRWPS